MDRAIFFDLDGTLTDPKEGITKCIQYALDRLGVEPPPPSDLEWCIGPPLHESMIALVGDRRAATAVAFYRERYSSIGYRENRLYTGITRVLERLRSEQLPLFVATSKPAVYAHKVLEQFELDRFFRGVFGSELDGTNASKSDLLRHALVRTRKPRRPTMIGDRSYDIVGATANGIDAIGVTYGYGTRSELVDAGARHIADSPSEIVEILL